MYLICLVVHSCLSYAFKQWERNDEQPLAEAATLKRANPMASSLPPSRRSLEQRKHERSTKKFIFKERSHPTRMIPTSLNPDQASNYPHAFVSTDSGFFLFSYHRCIPPLSLVSPPKCCTSYLRPPHRNTCARFRGIMLKKKMSMKILFPLNCVFVEMFYFRFHFCFFRASRSVERSRGSRSRRRKGMTLGTFFFF